MEQAARSGVNLVGVRALFVSPHFDDVALSCGGVVAARADRGDRVVVATVFAGEPAEAAPLGEFARFQHERWGSGDETADVRRSEDRAALAILGAEALWLPFLDAIYRGNQYRSDDDLFGPVKPEDASLCDRVGAELLRLWRATDHAEMYLPLGVGNHVDHQICHEAGRSLREAGATVWYYEDFPYAAETGAVEARCDGLDTRLIAHAVDVTEWIDRRLAAMAAYATQLPVIFRHFGPWEEVTRCYARSLASGSNGYVERLWGTPGGS